MSRKLAETKNARIWACQSLQSGSQSRESSTPTDWRSRKSSGKKKKRVKGVEVEEAELKKKKIVEDRSEVDGIEGNEELMTSGMMNKSKQRAGKQSKITPFCINSVLR
jgi:hypothetical protein